MRILFFHAYPHQYAGAQRLTHALASDLAARGDAVAIVVPDDGPFPARLAAEGLTTRVVRAPRLWRRYGGGLEGPLALPAGIVLPLYWLRLAREIRAWRPDVVHVNDHRGALLAAPAARLAGARVVWHVHGAYGSRAINLLGWLLATRIVAVSRWTLGAQPLLARLGGKVDVIHNGLLTGGSAHPRRAGADPLVATGARLHPEKGLDVLVRAAALLRPRFPQLRVVVAGGVQDGYELYGRELAELTRSLGVDDLVSFAGVVEDPEEVWAAATVYVQPSRTEPFGLAVLEAMALGVPVVTSRVGGLVELVEDGVSGLQVPSEDPEALADAIGRVLGDPSLAAELGEHGRERARTTFSHDRMVRQMIEVYEAAAQPRSSAAASQGASA